MIGTVDIIALHDRFAIAADLCRCDDRRRSVCPCGEPTLCDGCDDTAYGQDDNWVRINFARLRELNPALTNAEQVVAEGYANWVDRQVGVGIGRDAYFRIGLTPESFPDEKIVWTASGGLEFVGGNTGRSVRVRGVSRGSARLKVVMREGNFDHPEFPVYVTPCTNIPIHAVIVCKDGIPAQATDCISSMIEAANDIYAQVGMSFFLASICTTNIPNAYRITEEDVASDIWSHDRLTALRSNTGGVECYFVERIVDAEREPMAVNGMTSSSGIVLVRGAPLSTLAHEIGHLCDARDIYSSDKGGMLNLTADKVGWDRTLNDWNGGCMGRGSALNFRNATEWRKDDDENSHVVGVDCGLVLWLC